MVRFMPDGRLKTDAGNLLDAGRDMEPDEARLALTGAHAVLLHSYPDTEDLTGDMKRVASLLDQVSLTPDLEGYSARLYSGAERVLVIEHHH